MGDLTITEQLFSLSLSSPLLIFSSFNTEGGGEEARGGRKRRNLSHRYGSDAPICEEEEEEEEGVVTG